MKAAVALIALLPLAGFAINILFGRRYLRDRAHLVGVATVTASWLLSLYVIYHVFKHQDEAFVWNAFTWIKAGSFTVSWGFLVDEIGRAHV